jgi:hypothetical protein
MDDPRLADMRVQDDAVGVGEAAQRTLRRAVRRTGVHGRGRSLSRRHLRTPFVAAFGIIPVKRAPINTSCISKTDAALQLKLGFRQ